VTTESPTQQAQVGKRGGIFYGYWIVLAGSVLAAINGGLHFFGSSVFFKPIIDELGTNRAVLSGAFSLARLEGGLIGPLEGWLIDKFGPRKVLLLGIPLFATGFVLLSFVNSVFMFYVVFVLCLSFGSSLSSVAPASAAVANWFIRKRSSMLGFMLAGVGMGGAIVPVVTLLVSTFGWRAASVTLGVIVLVIGLPMATVIRHKPEQYGYLPDGDLPNRKPTADGVEDQTGEIIEEEEEGLSVKEALRTPAFWFMSLAFSLRVGVTGSVSLHFIPFMTDLGISLTTAGLMVSALGVVGVVGRLGFGWLGDIFPKRFVVTAGLIQLTIGMLILAFSTTLWHVVLALLFYAPSYGGLATMMFAMRAEYFGRRAFATIQGFMGSVLVLGTVSGPIYAGWIFDVTQSYRIAFLTFAVASASAILLILAARKPLAKTAAQ